MEQAVVQINQQAMLQPAMGASSDLFRDVSGDPFLQIIQTRMEQMLSENAQSQQEDTETPEAIAFLQNFAAMLLTDASVLPAELLSVDLSSETQSPSQQLVLPSGNPVVLSPSQPPADLILAAQELLNPDSAKARPSQPATPGVAFTVPVVQAGEGTELLAQVTLTGEMPDNRDSLSAQNAFASAVDTAKRTMRGHPQTAKPKIELDVDKLQSECNLPKAAQIHLTTQKAEPPVQESSLLHQLKTNISENLIHGKNEFTMKLKPESLGEITVKLVETEGKLTLHISTASAQAAKMINNDLLALREAVRPMQVEVHEAVQQTSQAPQESMTQFNMSGHQFAQQRQSFRQQSSHALHSGHYADDEAASSVQSQTASGLNIYI